MLSQLTDLGMYLSPAPCRQPSASRGERGPTVPSSLVDDRSVGRVSVSSVSSTVRSSAPDDRAGEKATTQRGRSVRSTQATKFCGWPQGAKSWRTKASLHAHGTRETGRSSISSSISTTSDGAEPSGSAQRWATCTESSPRSAHAHKASSEAVRRTSMTETARFTRRSGLFGRSCSIGRGPVRSGPFR